jgi:23S rRNA (cytidine1920-2'-O)/16S rRNA (cytidine1409-2'-O)-methyltransferase
VQSHSRRFQLDEHEQYVSRAAYKLASVSKDLGIEFKSKVVLDVGSSSGGFTQYALSRGAKKVIAIEKGTNQMNSLLRLDPRIELHEKTDIKDFNPLQSIDLVLIDVSFISLRDILPSIYSFVDQNSLILAMVKPQFESVDNNEKNKGVIKNEHIRRQILTSLELWLKRYYVIINKEDSKVLGTKGNKERFYLLQRSK